MLPSGGLAGAAAPVLPESPPLPMTEPRPAERVDRTPEDGAVRLLREVAAGPVSAVFAGERTTRLGTRRVAVKLLRELPEEGVDRLLDLRDRARLLDALGHRHHVAALDVARVDARFALVSPWVDGIDLLDWVDVLTEMGRVLPRRVSCEIVRAVAVALVAAREGLPPGADAPLAQAHHDLKPSNVLITRDGEVKITDFGTGFTALAGTTARTGALKKGLVRYLSPQRRDAPEERDGPLAHADIYALGVLALELFRGRWLKRLRSSNPQHDRHLSDLVARLEDLQMRSDSDDRMLRNLLLRMVRFETEARPDLSEVVSTFRALADRTEGPSLEAFAADHAVPWLEAPPDAPDTALQGIEVLVCERGRPLPAPRPDTLTVVTLPDRYDQQLANADSTGEFPVFEAEVTDPRVRVAAATPTGPPAPTEPAPGDTTPPAEPRREGARGATGPVPVEVVLDELSTGSSELDEALAPERRQPPPGAEADEGLPELELDETPAPAPMAAVAVVAEVEEDEEHDREAPGAAPVRPVRSGEPRSEGEDGWGMVPLVLVAGLVGLAAGALALGLVVVAWVWLL